MAMLWPLLHLRLACSPYAHRSQKITTQWLYLEQRRQQKHGRLTKLSHPTQLLTDQEWYEFDLTNQNVHSLQQRHGKAQSLVRWWAPFYLLVRKECLSYVQWYYSTVEFHSSTNCTNHAPVYLTSTFLSCLRRILARSRLGSWCAKPCQVSACLPLSIWCLAGSPWRDATFTIGTVWSAAHEHTAREGSIQRRKASFHNRNTE
jgi:hypothetical protein